MITFTRQAEMGRTEYIHSGWLLQKGKVSPVFCHCIHITFLSAGYKLLRPIRENAFDFSPSGKKLNFRDPGNAWHGHESINQCLFFNLSQ